MIMSEKISYKCDCSEAAGTSPNPMYTAAALIIILIAFGIARGKRRSPRLFVLSRTTSSRKAKRRNC